MPAVAPDPRTDRAPPTPRRARALALVAALACAGGELALRRAAPPDEARLPRVLQTRAAVRDRTLGFRLLPGLETRDEDGIAYRTNARGYRDREWPAPEPRAPGSRELRVAVLGDSVPYGSGVRVEDAFPRALERALGARLPQGASALVQSFAVPAYKLDQMRVVLERDALPYEPDLVVLFLGASSVRELPFDARALRWALVAERAGPLDALLERSLLYRRAADLLDGAARRGRAWLGVAREPPRPSGAALRARALDDLERLRARLAAAGVRLVVVASPWYEDVLAPEPAPSPWAAWAAGAPDVLLVDAAPLLRAAMPRLLEALGSGALALEDVWPRDGSAPAPLALDEEPLFLRHDRLHLGAAGHRALAEGVAARLAARNLLAPRAGDPTPGDVPPAGARRHDDGGER